MNHLPRRLASLGLLLALVRLAAWGVLAAEPGDATYVVVAQDLLSYLDAACAEAVFGVVLFAIGVWLWRNEPAAGSRRDDIVHVGIGSVWLALFAFTIGVLDRATYSRGDYLYFWQAWQDFLTRDPGSDGLYRMMQVLGWVTLGCTVYLQLRSAGRAALALATDKRIGMAVTAVGVVLLQLGLVAAVGPSFQRYRGWS